MLLKIKFPKTKEEFDGVLNKNISFEDLTVGSRQRIFWKCPKGKDHIWQASPNQRTSRTFLNEDGKAMLGFGYKLGTL